MDNRKEIVRKEQLLVVNGMELTEKEMHCIARLIQSGAVEDDVKCLYCRYAFECSEEYLQDKKLLFTSLIKKIEQGTGVNIFVDSETVHKEILAGSWIESRPELLERFTSMTFEEQLDSLKNPDILYYG